jgi:putative acetyltransferase
MALIIRTEQEHDQKEVAHITQQAFAGKDEVTLVERLRKSGVPIISLVAEKDHTLVAHILFSPVTLENSTVAISIAVLAPMAILPTWQNRGIGSKLVEAGLVECKEAGYEAIVVLGHPQFYTRFGFVSSVAHNIHSEYDVPPEVFMIKPLTEKPLEDCEGTIKYHQVFKEL